MAGATTALPPCSITDTPRGVTKEATAPIVEFKGVTKTFNAIAKGIHRHSRCDIFG